MKDFFRKIHIAMTLLLTTSIGHSYAAYNNSSALCGENICNSCSPQSCGKGFIDAEFLYWRASQGGLDICTPSEFSDVIESNGKVISRFKGKGRDPDFKWDPGFRLGAGYQFACSQWDIGAFITYFHSKTHDSRHGDNKVRWNVDFNVMDIVAGYNHNMCSCLDIRPFVGLRLARINEKLHINDFSDFSNSSPSTSSSLSSSSSSSTNVFITNDAITSVTKNKEKFRGLGPILGLEADWKIGCGFSFYVNASMSWLYGNFRTKLIDSTEGEFFLDYCEVSNRFDVTLSVIDAGLGIRWEKCLCNDRKLYLQLGLENHRYYDFNHIGNCGDLSFDGFNFGAGFQY